MAQQFFPGNDARVSGAFTVSSTATDPTTVTFKMLEPDGTTTTYIYGTDSEVVKDSTGNYHVDWPCTQEGVHWWRWIGTGTCAAADEGNFIVRESRF